MQACFIGHRAIMNFDGLFQSLRETVLSLISKGVTTFLFGSMSKFNDLAWLAVTELKKDFPSIKRVYVRSAFQYIDKLYEEYLSQSYEETYFSPRLKNAGKASYVERNFEMIDRSLYCVFYYDENYSLPPKRRVNHIVSVPQTRKSGTKIAFDYAKKKKKIIINLYNPGPM